MTSGIENDIKEEPMNPRRDMLRTIIAQFKTTVYSLFFQLPFLS